MSNYDAARDGVRAYLDQLVLRGAARGSYVTDLGAPDIACRLGLPRDEVVVALAEIAREPRSGLTPLNMVLFECGESSRLLVHIEPDVVRCPVHGQCAIEREVIRGQYYRFQHNPSKRVGPDASFFEKPVSGLAPPPTPMLPNGSHVAIPAVELAAKEGGQINNSNISINNNVTHNSYHYLPAVREGSSEPEKGGVSMIDRSTSQSPSVAQADELALAVNHQTSGEQMSMDKHPPVAPTVKIGATGKSKVTRITSIDTDAEIVAKEESVIEDVSLGVRTVEAPVEPWYKTKEGKIGIAVAVIGGIFAILAALIN